jgi:hypothetical protein
MLQKTLPLIIAILIGIQIPLIVSLSTARKVAGALESYKSKIEKISKPISKPIKEAAGVFSFIRKKVPLVKKIEKSIIPHALANGKESFEDAKEIVNQMYLWMYLSLFFTLFLILMLFSVSRKSFIKNIGISFLVSGGISLIELSGVYYFFIANFDSTFRYLYNQAEISPLTKLVPFVPSMVKAFSKDFIAYAANLVIARCFISALTSIPLGLLLSYGYKRLQKYAS